MLGWDVPFVAVGSGAEAVVAFEKALPVVPSEAPASGRAGTLAPSDGASVLASIEAAVGAVQDGRFTAVVTAPLHKANLYETGFAFPGHTEFLAHLCAAGGEGPRPVMMLSGLGLSVVPATIHVPLRDVPQLVTQALIVETCRIVANDLARRFGLASPRIAVTGLNPHAGESGTIGDEEVRTITPAIAELKAEGLDVFGPLAADSLFTAEARATFDAAVTMYHDQALIPIKTLAFDEAVNVTLGLPIVRTSPDHGTALDLAGTGRARPNSTAAALRLAAQMVAFERAA